MSPEERGAVMDGIRNLPEPEAFAAYMAFVERERQDITEVVLMCACENWLECAHAWPVILHG